MSKQNINQMFFVLGVLLVVLLAYYVYATQTTKKVEEKGNVEVRTEDHVRGNITASVTMVQFADFQCPACGAYEPIVREVMAKNSNDVKLVFRHFPLTNMHRNALLAAKYAEAAGRQNKFWELHDILYDKQKEWGESLDAESFFETQVASLGLDMAQIKKDVADPAIENIILAEYKEGTQFGVKGTPSFFINGIKIESPRSVEEFTQVIQKAKNGMSTTTYKTEVKDPTSTAAPKTIYQPETSTSVTKIKTLK